MGMDITQSQNNQQFQKPVASPQLVAANHVLALSTAELQALIYQEMAENPAMELEEAPLCPRCGCPLQGPTCQVCLQTQQADTPRTRDQDDYDDGSGWQQVIRSSDDDEFDPTTRVAAYTSLAEHLTLSLQAQFPERDAQLIEYLVGNLNEDGRLCCTIEEVMDLFDVPEAHIERIIRALQSMEPVGVGARDLRECLLIQLDRLDKSESIESAVVANHLEDLGKKRFPEIARSLGITVEEVQRISRPNSTSSPSSTRNGASTSPKAAAATRTAPRTRSVDSSFLNRTCRKNPCRPT